MDLLAIDKTFQLVLMDIMVSSENIGVKLQMPVMGGVESLGEIRGSLGLKELPVLAVNLY